MEAAFWQQNQAFFQGQKILLAASAGVDSQVLLHLLTKLPVTFGVAHVDHGLRAESKAEADFLRTLCHTLHVPFYETRWQTTPSSGVEEQARAFRYHFFEQVMEEAGYELLFTAHHGDDQAETMLMRLVRGGSLATHAGIKKVQPFATGQLVRPLLSFEKAALYRYAQQHQLQYLEDASNFSDAYLRNRLRHHVLPKLKQENPQVLQHFAQFSQQLFSADDALKELLANRLSQVTETSTGWQFARTLLPENASTRYYFLQFFCQQCEVAISQKQLQQVLTLMTKTKSQWTIDLENGWQFFRSYEQLGLMKTKPVKNVSQITLTAEEAVALSETETVCLRQSTGETSAQYQLELPLTTALPLVIRRRRPGDRIQLSPTLFKKVRRYLIDQKIPQKKREQLWVVTDANDRVLALLPLVNSYLSIRNETDRIHYILEYNAQGKN